MMKNISFTFTQYSITLICLIIKVNSAAYAEPIINYNEIFHPVPATNGMVVSRETVATQVGADILKQGGNAIDAAVAVGFALAVTLPQAGNLGGGGFMMIHLAKEQRTFVIDYRELAPAKAHRDMFLDKHKKVNRRKALFSYQASGVPGTVAGLVYALENYGTLNLKKVIQPAINLAEKGIIVSQPLAFSLQQSRKRLSQSPESLAVYYKEDGSNYIAGDILKQANLAWSLRQIQQQGKNAFYEGEIAQKIAHDMAKNNGWINLDDLKNYQAIERAVVSGTYRGYKISSAPPPSSGGIHIIQMLNILEHYPLKEWGHNSAKTIHVMAEAMKYAYADRSRFLGDPDFIQIPTQKLISKHYAKQIIQQISLQQSTASKLIAPGKHLANESDETTHFSIMDKSGNVVTNTYTLNLSFGSGHAVPGTGILLNNEMNDFSAKPGSANIYGLLGGEANAIAPYKRPLSSMSPTIVFNNGQAFLVSGARGGSRIITAVLQIILNVIDHNMNIASATAAPRIHHQWFPDVIRLEPGISVDTMDLLKNKGHKIKIRKPGSTTQSLLFNQSVYYGAADPRWPEGAAIGF